MKGFSTNIQQQTVTNSNYREVLYTGKYMQLVVMCLPPQVEIGEETHHGHDQFIRVEEGQARCSIDDSVYILHPGDAVVIPSGAKHNVINTGNAELKLYTLYGPPEHMNGTIHQNKADEKHQHFDGTTSE